MNRLKGARYYHCGPMQSLPDSGIGYRKIIEDITKKFGLICLDPTNKPSSVAKEDIGTREILLNSIKSGKYEYVHEVMREICAIDLRLVDISDFLILYHDPNIPTCGTWHEMGMAILQRKPVLVLCPSGLDKIPLWLWGVGKYQEFFTSIEQLDSYLAHLAYDQNIEDLGRWKFLNWEKI